ncbi:ribonuclease P protein component [Ectothiorhodospira shaposhnikovii]|uniref:ribonuclease P protein component n=1 Tax=Ectothiorhodospira shaposhnikovii TaxID=1054 RepID=UPI003084554C
MAARCWPLAAPGAVPVFALDQQIVLNDQGFPRHVRLLQASDYHRVFRDAHRVSQPPFTGLWALSPTAGPRLGMAVAKKNVRQATQRNRIKRLIRESFRRHRSGMAPMDMVIMCKPGAQHFNNADLHQALERLWKRMSSQCEKSLSS